MHSGPLGQNAAGKATGKAQGFWSSPVMTSPFPNSWSIARPCRPLSAAHTAIPSVGPSPNGQFIPAPAASPIAPRHAGGNLYRPFLPVRLVAGPEIALEGRMPAAFLTFDPSASGSGPTSFIATFSALTTGSTVCLFTILSSCISFRISAWTFSNRLWYCLDQYEGECRAVEVSYYQISKQMRSTGIG